MFFRNCPLAIYSLVTHFDTKIIIVLDWAMELGNDLYTYCYTDDDTYMEDVSDLKQYLLNDVGTIWRGTLTNPSPYFWEYGQVHISVYYIVHILF